MRHHFLYLLLFATVFGGNLKFAAAQDCQKNIENANRAYKVGKFDQVISDLSDCLDSDDDRISWQANRLVAMAHLAQKNNDKARPYAIRMMELNPTYKGSVLNDPADLVSLLKTITVIPEFSLGVGAALAMNFTRPNVWNMYSVADYNKTYTGKRSFQFGGSAAYQFNKAMALELGLEASYKAYELDYSFGNWDLNADERLTYIRMPLTLKYFFPTSNRVRPYVRLGGYMGTLIASENNFNAYFKLDSTEYDLTHVSSMERRNKLDYGLIGGLGARLASANGDGQWFVQLSYAHSLTNITDKSTRYKFTGLVHEFFYVDDDMSLNNVSFEIGYNRYINYKVLKN